MSKTRKSAAVVIGASGGIGGAFEATLVQEGAYEAVHGFARSRSGMQHLDLLDEDSIAAAAAQVARGPEPTLVLVATGLLHEGDRGPEKTLRSLDPDWLARLYAVFAALSARVGSIADNRLGGWHGYRASKAALNMFVRNLAIEERRRNDRAIVAALHPGTVETALSKPFRGNIEASRLFDPERAALQLLDVVDELKPTDSGKLFDFEGNEIPF
jgi:NAD(P)-dependent dehydrogenase (short-subunit alcohol dehydrogenase family)